MSNNITPEAADQLADLLNQVCSLTIDALLSGELTERLGVAAVLRDLHAQFEEESAVAPFVLILIEWLEGLRPSRARVRALDDPFRRALQMMLQQVPESGPQAKAQEPQEPQEPISRRVLAQLISAVVAAEAAGDVEVQRELAAQLLNIQTKLEGEWHARLSPLLENLRAVLGGADPRILPPIEDALYGRFWTSAMELLIHADLHEDSAKSQLLDRLIHNAIFVTRAADPELTEGFLRSLLDVQRQAVESGATPIATLVSAIRAFLQGMDPTPFTSMLAGEELEAWMTILEAAEEEE